MTLGVNCVLLLLVSIGVCVYYRMCELLIRGFVAWLIDLFWLSGLQVVNVGDECLLVRAVNA